MRALNACLVLLAVGCGGKSATEVCTAQATADCALIDQCRMNGTAITYGSSATCIQRQRDNCVRSLMAPSTGNSPDHTDACAKALPTETCAQFLQNTPVAACAQVTGALDNDAPCAFNGQCTTGFCAVPKGSLCGTCANVPAPGDACDQVTACGPGQTCTPSQTCQPWVQVGGACDGMTMVCAPEASCVIAAGATSGTCMADVATMGGTCDNRRQTAPACDPLKGVFCQPQTKTCVPLTYVSAGTACGAQMMGMSDNACTSASECFVPATGTGATCLADAMEGQPCDIMVGPGCLSPGRCVVDGAGTSGMCVLPDASMCM